MERAVHDEDAAPDDVTGFGDAFEGTAAETEVHRRLAFARRAFVAADEMRGRRGAGDEENPNVIVDLPFTPALSPRRGRRRAAVMLAPAQIVECIFGREAK